MLSASGRSTIPCDQPPDVAVADEAPDREQGEIQPSPSAHCNARSLDRPRQRSRRRDSAGSSLGEKSQRGSSRPGGSQCCGVATSASFDRADPRRVPQRQLLGDLALDQA